MWPILQTAAAATAAWYAAVLLLPDGRPSFASIAAVICLGASYGQRGSKALQLVAGVVLGICVASAMVALIGAGSLQIGLMVVLAMSAAVLLGGGELLTAESAVSAILIVSLDPGASDGFTLNRILEGVIGGGVALAVTSLLFPPDPALHVARAAQAVFAGLGAALERLAAALAASDPRAAARGAGRGARGSTISSPSSPRRWPRPRDRPALAAPARRRWPSSTATARASPRSTSRSATRACSPATPCGCCAPASPCPERCPRRSASSGSRSGRSPAPTTSPSAPTPPAGTPCARARWPARHAGEAREVVGQIRSTAVDLRRAADLLARHRDRGARGADRGAARRGPA